MRKLKMYLVGASGLAVLALSITLLSSSGAGAQQAEAQQAPQAKQPPPKPPTPVDIVRSDITLPVFDIDNGRQPFQASAHSVMAGATNGDFQTIAFVPAGKRLVIENISANGRVPAGQPFLNLHISTNVANGGSKAHYLVMSQQGSVGNTTWFAASQQVRLYADPGTSVTFSVFRVAAGPEGVVDVTISGYLIDVAQFEEIP